MLYSIIKSIAYILFKIFFNIKIYGKDNIPTEGPVIIASNHLSYLDPIALTIASARKLNFIAKAELFDNNFFGQFIRNLGAFPLKKDSLRDVIAIKEAIRRLKQNKTLIIFPEGTRSTDGRLKTALAGVGMLATKVGCPVVPAYIKGSDKALPVHAKFIRLFQPISVYFAERVEPLKEDSKEAYRKLSDEIMKGVANLKKLSN